MPSPVQPRAYAALPVVVTAAICQTAFAEDKQADRGGAVVVALVLLITPVMQLVLAALLPGFTRRAQRAISRSFWPCAGWGALLVVLSAVVAGVLSKGGRPGEVLGTTIALSVLLAAIAGCLGISKLLGDWSLRLWGMESLGPLSVFIGGAVWAIAVAVPILGWVAGVLTLLASLGATVQSVLHPQHFEEPCVPASPPPADPAPGSQSVPQGETDTIE